MMAGRFIYLPLTSPARASGPEAEPSALRVSAQGFKRASVLQQQRGRHGGVTGIGVNGRPVLRGVQEDFSGPAVLEPAHAGGVSDAPMLEVEQFVAAPVREAPAACH